MKIVTVLLTGIPFRKLRGQFTLENLAVYLNEKFGQEEIGTFRVREVYGRDIIALDFDNGYDAMIAQSVLDKTLYTLDNNQEHILRARITHDPAMMAQEPVVQRGIVCSPSDHSSISEVDDDIHLKKMDRKIKTQLNVLKIKKKLIETEKRLLEKERLKIKKSFKKDKHYLNSSGHKAKIARKISVTTTSSDTESSDEMSPMKYTSSKQNRARSKDRQASSKNIRFYPKNISFRSRRERSCSRNNQSCSRNGRSRSRNGRSRSRNGRSRSRDGRSRSRNGRSRSRNDRSRSKNGRSRARDGGSSSRNGWHYSSGGSRSKRYKYTSRNSRSPSKFSQLRIRSPESRRSVSFDNLSSNESKKQLLERIGRFESQEKPVIRKAIEYRPDISENYVPETRRVNAIDTTKDTIVDASQHTPGTDADRHVMYNESIVVNSTRIKKENAKKIVLEQIEEKKKEAVKDILLDLEKAFNNLSSENGATDIDRKSVLYKMVDKINKRMDRFKVSNAMNVSNIVMHYRCKYSKIEDEFLVGEIFNDVIGTNHETKENALQYVDPFLSELDDILQDFDLNVLEDRNPKIEPEDDVEEGEITDDEDENITVANIVINIVPTENGTHDKTKKRYFLTKQKLIQQWKPFMREYSEYVQYELIRFILELKIEQMVDELLKDVSEKLKTAAVLELFRRKYPTEKDEEFLLNTIRGIWRGDYNDSVRNMNKSSEVDLSKVKQEKQTGESSNSIESEQPVVIPKTEKPDTVNNNMENMEVNTGTKLIATSTSIKSEQLDPALTPKTKKPDTVNNNVDVVGENTGSELITSRDKAMETEPSIEIED